MLEVEFKTKILRISSITRLSFLSVFALYSFRSLNVIYSVSYTGSSEL